MCFCASLSPLHTAACGDSGAELVVQLSQSSIAILCAASYLGLGRDGTRHCRDWNASPFRQFFFLEKKNENNQRSSATCIHLHTHITNRDRNKITK